MATLLSEDPGSYWLITRAWHNSSGHCTMLLRSPLQKFTPQLPKVSLQLIPSTGVTHCLRKILSQSTKTAYKYKGLGPLSQIMATLKDHLSFGVPAGIHCVELELLHLPASTSLITHFFGACAVTPFTQISEGVSSETSLWQFSISFCLVSLKLSTNPRPDP